MVTAVDKEQGHLGSNPPIHPTSCWGAAILSQLNLPHKVAVKIKSQGIKYATLNSLAERWDTNAVMNDT